MKRKLQIIGALGVLLLGCTKDFGDIIIDTFDFTFEGTNEQGGFVYQELTTTFDIIANRQVDESVFYFDYDVVEGEGYFEDVNGNILTSGEILLDRLNWEYKYVPTVTGTHKIMTKALDYRKNVKEVELEYEVDFAPFTVLLNGGSNQYIINRNNDLELIMLSENSSVNLKEEYKVSYSIDGGIGEIRLNGENVSTTGNELEYETLSVGREYLLGKGSTELEYFPTTLGTHTITMTCTSPDGQVKIVTLDILVENVTFFINADSQTTNGSVGEDLLINITLQTTDLEDAINYELVYYFAEDSEGSGTILNENNEVLASAAQYDIEPGTYSYTFNSDVVGVKKIYFDISDSNNQIKRDSVIFNYSTSPFTFTGSTPSTNVNLNESIPINYILNSLAGDNVEYTFTYRSNSGNGTLVDELGNDINPNTGVIVDPGTFSYSYSPETIGQHELVFALTDNFGQSSDFTIIYNVGSTFSFNASSPRNTYNTDENANINFNLVGNGNFTAFYSTSNDGVLTYNGVSVAPGTNFNIVSGNTIGNYQAFTEGTHNITFEVFSEFGETREANISLEFELPLISTSTFSATPVANSAETDASVGIEFRLDGDGVYTGTFSNSSDGSFVYAGNIYGPGESFNITTGTSFGSYTGIVNGVHNLNFTVTSNTGETLNDDATITFNPSVNFEATAASNNVPVGDNVNIDFNLTGSETYTAVYANTNTGVFVYGGVSIAPGQTFNIVLGESTGIYNGSSDGSHQLNFTVTSDSGLSASDVVTITYSTNTVSVDGVLLNPPSINLVIGSDFGLTAEVTPLNATNQNVFWSSSDNGVVTINQTGVITGVSAGTATITVTTEEGGFTASSVITVQAATVSVSSVSVNPTSATIIEGNTTSLTATVSPNNATNQNVTYSSSNNGVATVNATGVVTGVSAGTATITVTTQDGGFTATATITVLLDTSIGFTVNAVSTSVNVNDNVNINFDLLGAETYTATYNNSNTGLLIYNGISIAPGQNFAINIGSTTGIYNGSASGTHALNFTVTSNTGETASDNTSIQYNNATVSVSGVSVNPTSATIIEGNTTSLTATVSPNNATNQNVTYSSSNNGVATVNAAGVVTGVSAGTATITVTTQDGGFSATATITVQAATVSVSGVNLNPSSVTITEGNTTSLTATVSPNNATNQNVTYSSSNNGVATVNAAGVVTGVSAGTATVTVTTQDGGFTDTTAVTVNATTVSVSGVNLNPSSVTITEGNTTSLTATVSPNNATNQNVTYSSSNNGVATVNAAGVVTGVSAGTATITVTTQDGGFSATSTITVQAATVVVSGVSVNPTSATIIEGNTTSLTATVSPNNATNQNVTYSSSNNGVATVNAAGVVTGVSAGTATITVTTQDGGFSATATITVQAATVSVSGVSVNPTSATIIEGNTTSLTATVSPNNATNQNVTYSSSNNGVATVNAAGVVTGVSAGTATITVTTQDGGFTDTTAVTVNAVVNNDIIENAWAVPIRIANAAQIRDRYTYGPNNFESAFGNLTIRADLISRTAGATGDFIEISEIRINAPGGAANTGPSIDGVAVAIPNDDNFTIYFDIYADRRGASYVGASTLIRFTITNGATTITRDYTLAQD